MVPELRPTGRLFLVDLREQGAHILKIPYFRSVSCSVANMSSPLHGESSRSSRYLARVGQELASSGMVPAVLLAHLLFGRTLELHGDFSRIAPQGAQLQWPLVAQNLGIGLVCLGRGFPEGAFWASPTKATPACSSLRDGQRSANNSL